MAHRRLEATTTSEAPASRCCQESLPGRSISKAWCACLMVETFKPRATSTGITLVINVVLPEPLQPARPMTRIDIFEARPGLKFWLKRSRCGYDKDRPCFL